MTYRFSSTLNGLTLSAAINDLSFISWKDVNQGVSKSDEPFVFDEFTDIATIGNNNDNKKLGDQFDNKKNDLEKVLSVYNDGKTTKKTLLAATINLGADIHYLNTISCVLVLIIIKRR